MEPGGLWDADRIDVRGSVFHNGRLIEEVEMSFAGRPNVFESRFSVPRVEKDYEVLHVTVQAAQADTANFGFHQGTCKLLP